MTAGHLVSHAQLALLGNVHFGQLDNSGREFVPVGQVVFLALENRIQFLVLDRIVVDRLFDQRIQTRVARPFIGADIQVVEFGQHFLRETRPLRDQFHPEIIADTDRRFVFEQRPQFFDQTLFQRIGLLQELGLHLFQLRLFGSLALLAVLIGAAEQFLIDHDAEQRRLRLQRSVFHIAGLVAEDRTQQFLFRRRIALPFRRDLTDQDIARLHIGADADDTVLVEIFRSVFADVRNVGSKLLDTAFGIAHFHNIFVDMHRSEDILADHAFRDHDGILEVVTLPRHERHFQVAPQRQLAALRRITFGHDLPFGHFIALANQGFQGHRRALIGLTIARQTIGRHFRIERNDLLVFGTFVFDLNLRRIREDDFSFAFGDDLDPAVGDHVFFQTRSDDRSLRHHQRHGLTHHVRSHQRTVGIVVFEERDQAGGDRRNLVRSNVHQIHFRSRHHRKIAVVARFDLVRHEELARIVQRSVGLRNGQSFLLFGAEIMNPFIRQIDPSVRHFAVRRFDKAHVADFRVNAQRRNQSDVRAFRRFDRTQTAVMGIVHVAHFESGALTRQTAGPQSRQAALMGHFGQRIGLIHELRQLVRSEERIDDRRQRFGIDQVYRCKHFVVAHVHPFADRTRHADETYAELVGQLLAHCAYAAVRQVVDIVHVGLRVD